jgi:hypothetical protein
VIQAVGQSKEEVRPLIPLREYPIHEKSVCTVRCALFAWPEVEAASHGLSVRDHAIEEHVRTQVLVLMPVHMGWASSVQTLELRSLCFINIAKVASQRRVIDQAGEPAAAQEAGDALMSLPKGCRPNDPGEWFRQIQV